MIELRRGVEAGGVESLINELARHPNFDEVHVRHEKVWTWTRHIVDPDDAGIRYSNVAVLSVAATNYQPGRETELARLILEDGDLVTHIEVDESQPYSVILPLVRALGLVNEAQQ